MEGFKISIEENISIVNQNIEKALSKVGRNGDDVELIAVTKTVDVENINKAIKANIRNIGENRVQELDRKYEEIKEPVNYHMIGHLQTNKVKYIIGKTKLVHSLDRISLAKELNKRSSMENLITEVLIQVNVAEEESKFGLKTDEVLNFVENILDMKNIKIRGLMTIAPHITDEMKLRNVFRRLYNLREEIKKRNYNELSMDYLSMGMTNDYTIAIEEGSNMVRVGTGIFGTRNY